MSMTEDAPSGELPFSEACERNKEPILQMLQTYLPSAGRVLEIGSGTGQHAVYFASRFPDLHWQPSDTGDYLHGLRARLTAEAPANVAAVIELDVRQDNAAVSDCAAVFSANTLHFMSIAAGAAFFRVVDRVLQPGGRLIVYGPFRYNDAFTTPSNARFDQWLKSTHPDRGVRDFEWVDGLAKEAGLELLADHAMPANNQCLVWGKSTAG